MVASTASSASKKVSCECSTVDSEACQACDDPSGMDLVCLDKEQSSACSDAEPEPPVQGTPDDDQQTADEPAASYFCGVAALECRGLTSLWQILSLTMVPEKSGPEIMGPDLVSNVPLFDLVVCSCDLRPPEPPPRIGVAGFRAVPA